MASLDESIDSGKYATIQALMLQSPTHVAQNAKSPSSSPASLRKIDAKFHGSQPPPRFLPETKAPRKIVGSAPDMNALLAEINSQRGQTQDKSASMPGFPLAFDDGDTQPMPSQVYRDYQSMYKSRNGLDGTEETETNGGDYAALANTLREGDAGHVNLTDMWNTNTQGLVSQPADGDEQSVEGSDGDKQETQDLLSSLRRESYMKTPATTGQKRHRSGDVVSPTTGSKTPGSGISNFFGGTKTNPMMTATQLFDMTQADSSPLPEIARSDPVETRPSPNFVHIQHTPPEHAASSPVKRPTSTGPRNISEPRDAYTSMDESQRRRQQQMQAVHGSRPTSRVLFDTEEDLIEPQHNTKLIDERLKSYKSFMDGQARSTLKPVKARIPAPRASKSPATTMDQLQSPYLTPAHAAKEKGEIIEVSDDVSSDDEGSVDVYNEYAQEIVPSQRQSSEPARGESPMIDEHEDDVEMDDLPSIADHETNEEERAPSPIPQSPPHIANEGGRTRASGSAPPPGPSSTFLAVADSQPDRDVSSQPPPRPVEPSSIASYIPGSQIAPLSSQTRAEIAARINDVKSSSWPMPPADTQAATNGVQHNPPSSPPVPESSHVVPEPIDHDISESVHINTGGLRSQEVAGSRRSVVEEPQQDRSQAVGRLSPSGVNKKAQEQVPINNMMQSSKLPSQPEKANESAVQANSLSKANSSTGPSKPFVSSNENSSAAQTRSAPTGTTLFGTAHTHVSNSQSSSQPVRLISESPRKAAGIRSLADIAVDPTPPDETSQVDISVGLDLMTAEDDEFMNAMRSPAKKPTMTYGRKSKVRASEKKPLAAKESKQVDIAAPLSLLEKPVEKASSPVGPARKRRRLRIGKPAAVQFDQSMQDVTPEKQRIDPDNDQALEQEKGGQERPTTTEPEVVKAPRQSPDPDAVQQPRSKDVEDVPQPAKPAPREVTPVVETLPSGTPPSVRKREEAGLRAAEQARTAVLKQQHRLKRKPPAQKKGRKKSVTSARKTNTISETDDREIEMPGAEQAEQPSMAAPTAPEEARADEIPVEPSAGAPMAGTDNPATGAAEGATTPVEIHAACQNRVLASFRGNIQGFYPATCIGPSGSGESSKYLVRFDDGSVDTIERHLVCSFTLREGDLIKVDLPKMKASTYVVTGFGEVAENVGTTSTDIYGHAVVQVYARPRQSLPTPPPTARMEIVDVPVEKIYVTQSMWQRFADRLYIHRNETANGAERLGTPSTAGSVPVTPRSRSRRQNSLLNVSHIPTIPFDQFVTTKGVFSNMAFAVSISNDHIKRDEITQMIVNNGGRFLSEGFHELFDLPSTDDSDPPSPAKAATNTKDTIADSISEPLQPLKLKPSAAALGFVALISDTVTRREKHIQALSLSLPVLHLRWLHDSLRASAPLAFGKYLLPAGESILLSKSLHSRTLTPYSPSTAKLSEVVQKRAKLLDGGGVLLICSGGPKIREKRRVYAFLSLALGARRVRIVNSAEVARDAVLKDDGRWRWVHCEDRNLGKVTEVVLGVLGEAVDGAAVAAGGGKKRKRDVLDGIVDGDGKGDGEVREGEFKLSNSRGDCRVVGDEFVIQSLIAGALIEE